MRVAWHLGLGDAIVCAPIIAKLAKENPFVEVPCWKHNLISVIDIYSDIPNVSVFVIEDDSDFKNYEYKLGFYNEDKPALKGEDFITWFFRQAGMTEAERWFYNPIERDIEHIETEHEYIFVHEKYEHPVNINTEKVIIKPELGFDSILGYINTLNNAKEIHCIDSAFLHLVEAIPTTGKLFFHKYARNGGEMSNFKLRKEWTVYENN